MIISKLQGGLGNQLFQWAYGKFMSIEYNTPLLALSWLSQKVGLSYDWYENLMKCREEQTVWFNTKNLHKMSPIPIFKKNKN